MAILLEVQGYLAYKKPRPYNRTMPMLLWRSERGGRFRMSKVPLYQPGRGPHQSGGLTILKLTCWAAWYDRLTLGWWRKVSRGGKVALRGTDPKS